MLTEQIKSPPCLSEDDSGFYWDQIVMMSDGTTQVQPVSPVTFGKLIATDTNRGPENPRILA